MATITLDYNVSRDGGQTWQPARKVFTGIRNPYVLSKPGELHKVWFLAEHCDETQPEGEHLGEVRV